MDRYKNAKRISKRGLNGSHLAEIMARVAASAIKQRLAGKTPTANCSNMVNIVYLMDAAETPRW